jgi:signal transduction histidine kinase
MRRLYLQIYLTFVATFLLFGVLGLVAWWLAPPSAHQERMRTGMEALLGDLLPGADAPADEVEKTLEALADRLVSDLAVYDPQGRLVASAGGSPPPPPTRRAEGGFRHWRAAFDLPGGRVLAIRHQLLESERDAVHLLVALCLLAAAFAIGAYPVVRRITARLERLRCRVEELGAGDLRTRVEVEGRDEVADLARSFNRAAQRIEHLVEAQRTLLASASHELRSPLTRIRVAIELLAGSERPELRDRVSRDVEELDALIGEILLASRLDALDPVEGREDVDLLALVAEEGARTGAQVGGEPVSIQGHARLLRHLVRNLLANAACHAAGSPVEACVSPRDPGGARLVVADRGPGVSEPERERIFEPFYRRAGTRSGEGAGGGLGLALVRRIAHHHGGEVRCLPREGGGSWFEVTLAG